MNEFVRMTATEAVAGLRSKTIKPTELVAAAAARIAAVEPKINALPILDLDRAMDQVVALAEGHPL